MAKPPKEPKTNQDERAPSEEEVIRRMLNTPPKPHKDSKKPRKSKPKRGTRRDC